MKRLWSSVLLWGPGVISLVTLLAVVWYGRFLEGRLVGLDDRVAEQMMLRQEIQTWQAYVVSLQRRMIETGIAVPDSPRPVTLIKTGRRPKVSTR